MSSNTARLCDVLGKDMNDMICRIYMKIEEVSNLCDNGLRETRIEQLTQNIDKTKQKINDVFNEIIRNINLRKNELLTSVDKDFKKKKKELNNEITRDNKIKNELIKYKKDIKKIIIDKKMDYNIKKTKLSSVVNDYNKRKMYLNPSLDDITMSSCSFRMNIKSQLFDNIKSWGKIDSEDEKVVENLNNIFSFKNAKIKITCVGCNNLMAADSNGFSDPYCKGIYSFHI